MALRVYLGAPSNELGRVVMMASKLDAAGVHITERWWLEVQANGGVPDSALTPTEQLRRARRDLTAVQTADLVWLLWPATVSHGVACELGYALAYGGFNEHPVIVSGAFADACIFTSLAERVSSDMEALDRVLSLAANHTAWAPPP